jgi:transposase
LQFFAKFCNSLHVFAEYCKFLHIFAISLNFAWRGIAMDETDEKILEEYNSKRQRPQLLRNSELILGLHKRGATLKEIANILNEEKQIVVPPCTLSRFIARQEHGLPKRRKVKPQEIMPRGETNISADQTPLARPSAVRPATRDEDAWRRIEALKQKPVKQEPAEEEVGVAPIGPLTLVKRNKEP